MSLASLEGHMLDNKFLHLLRWQELLKSGYWQSSRFDGTVNIE